MAQFVTRFAPSPTGYLHRGHAYSALTAVQAAQDADGRFILRIEDIDATRCRAHAVMVLPQLGPMALAPLAEAGVTPLVFKGATLAERYPEPGLRPMDDADLLVRPGSLGAACGARTKAARQNGGQEPENHADEQRGQAADPDPRGRG